jgi:hypothetical protein
VGVGNANANFSAGDASTVGFSDVELKEWQLISRLVGTNGKIQISRMASQNTAAPAIGV